MQIFTVTTSCMYISASGAQNCCYEKKIIALQETFVFCCDILRYFSDAYHHYVKSTKPVFFAHIGRGILRLTSPEYYKD